MDDRDHLIAVCGIIDTLLIRRRELIRGHIQDAATKRAEPLPAEHQVDGQDNNRHGQQADAPGDGSPFRFDVHHSVNHRDDSADPKQGGAQSYK